MRKTFVLISAAASPSVLMEQCGLPWLASLISVSHSASHSVFPTGGRSFWAVPSTPRGPGAVSDAGIGAKGGASTVGSRPAALFLPPFTILGEDDGFDPETGKLPGEGSCIA